jgi:precorrin-8X/cobalt-precorrin-8 methylmutase
MQTEKGQSIEDKSMQIIDGEIGTHDYNEREWPIVRRVIHATADFDFARDNKIIFHKDAIENGINALKNGCNIIVDVNGVIGGLNKQNLKDFGVEVICNISNPEIVNEARKYNKTRAVSASESKEELATLNAPFITNHGRKGGSPCASSIVNALFKLLRENSSS